ncbi:NAD-dependent dehydratase, partial [Candidatus Magnetomorum sp. HK-1]
MNLNSKKILITGAGGFVGSHLVETLVTQGDTVKCFIHYNSRNDFGLLSEIPVNLMNEVQVISGDLRDSHAIYQALKGINIVFHLGALIAIPYSYKHPE